MAGNWRDITRDAVAVRAREAQQRSRGASHSTRISRVGFSVDAHPFVVRAANTRGISVSGYIRRATLAMAALDLGMDPRLLFARDSAITPIGRVGAMPTKDLDGELYGIWAIQKLPAYEGELEL